MTLDADELWLEGFMERFEAIHGREPTELEILSALEEAKQQAAEDFLSHKDEE